MQVTRFPEDDFGRTHPRLVEPVLLDAPDIGYQQNVGAEIRDVKTLEADVSR